MTQEKPVFFETSFRPKIFSGLGSWQSLIFQEAVTPKLLRFVTEREQTLCLASVISGDEKMLWQSFEDLLNYSLQLATPRLQGIFCLEVLSADIRAGIRHFQPKDFSALLANHARQLGFGRRTLVRYGQIFCLLEKRAPADWGEIKVLYHVEVVNREKMRLAGFLSRMMKTSGHVPGALYLIHDLGLAPAWDLEKERQEKKLGHILQKNPSSVYVCRSETQPIAL